VEKKEREKTGTAKVYLQNEVSASYLLINGYYENMHYS